nr:MAG TPA: collagen alpha 1(VIII) chain protein [Caudoviricetes sp.]
MIKTKIYTKPKNTGASGGGTTKVTRLQGIATEAEYASKAGRASEADKAKEAGSAQYAEQAGHAGTAGYATKAGEVDLSAEALDHFARKDQDETFKGKVGFEQDVNIEGAASFADVVTMLKKLKAQGGIETDYVRSANYDEDTQQGFGLLRTKNGGYRLSLSGLEVWSKAIFHELEIRKLSYAGGNIYLSGAGSKIVHVEEQYSASGVTTGWKCYLLADDGSTATQNLWRVKDQARCQSFNILEGKHEGVSNKSYWRLVTGVSTHPVTIKTADGTALYGGRLFDWVTLSATDCMAGSDTPAAGDTIVLDGASEDATRQGVLMLESTGNGTPRIVGLRGVSSYTHEGKEVFVFSPGGSKIVSSAIEWVSSAGDTIHLVNYRGEWQKGVSYGHYDQVNHNNALWTCVNPNGCNSEPKDGTADWQKVLSGEKGEQGAQGPKGETGVQGPQGEKGDQGEKGEQGIKGDKGEDGLDGADGLDGTDGISILIERPLVFDTDDTGKVPTSVLQSKKAVVRVMQGGVNVSGLVKKLTIDNAAYCSASASVKTDQDSGSYIEVQLNSISDVQTEAGVVSAPCGFVVLLFMLGGNPYRVQVPFAVNVAKYMGSVKATAKQYQSQFETLENDLKRSNPTVLNAYTSTIKQTAKEITLSVTQSQQGRHNLLRDTALTRKGDINYSDGLFQPTITQGVNGHNAIRFSVTGDGTPQYYGLFWGRSINGIAVKKNTDYTFSAWIKCDTKDLQVYSEVFKMAAQNGDRGDRITATSGNMQWQIKENEVNQWRQVNYTFNTDDAEFIEVNIFVYNGITVDGTFGYTASGNGWICMPMLEEGSEYTGWTPAETDYDYLGGNMLDDTRTLVASGQLSNLYTANEVAQDTYEGAYAVVHGKADSSNNNMCDFLRFNGENGRILNFELRKNYVFSFLAKGSGTLRAHLYKDSVHVNIYAENSQGKVTENVADGASNFTLTSEWKRYWVHWRIDPYTGDGDTVLPQSVMLRAVNGCEAWVTKPKLEEGALMTEYTEKKTDLIDKATAKAAGLEITADGVELYGDKVKVKNNGKTAAMFTDGKLNADLIDANTINVHHVWAKDKNNQNTLAHFGNYDIDEAKDEDGKQYPLWVGSSTAADSPFRVSKDGYMYADKGAFGVRYYEDEDSGTRKKFGRFEITGEGLSSGAVFKEDSMMLTDTRFQLIKAEGRSAIFIDTDQTLAVPGPGTYLSAKMRVDAIDTTDGYHSNVCYFAEAKNGVQNYALRGIGDVSVNGGVYGYKYTMINMTTKNVFLDNTGLFRGTTYNEVQKIDSLTLIVSSKNYLALALPTLGTIKQILFGSQYVDDKFCVRLTIVMDIGSESIAMRGRCTTKDNANVAQWNTKDLPLITHWNGGYWSDFDMTEGDAYDLLLTYDPNKSYTLEGFTQPYLARIINRQY